MNRERISNMTTNKQGQTYKKVQRRKEWVQYLNSNNHRSNLSPSQKEEIFKWAKTAKYTLEDLQKIIHSIK